ncbi:MAG: DUF3810 domain-containing protein [Ferruginibacter sp.]
MKPRFRILILALLVILVMFVHAYSLNSERVEWQYSNGFFPSFAATLRRISGWFPISIGDILYGLAAIWLIIKAWKYFKRIANARKNKISRQSIYDFLLKTAIIACSFYIIFNVFWAINYNRKGIAWQLGLDMKAYTTSDLKEMNCLLIAKVNKSKTSLIANNKNYPSNKLLYQSVYEAYKEAEKEYGFMEYEPADLKTSLWGWLGNYSGFTGYYNPFTGEAQLNTTVPKFLQPFIACHEVAHQVGYAKEMEANFVGYLAASASNDTLFHYSVYLELFTYANRNLFFVDSVAAKLYRKELLPEVVKDIKEWREFARRHQGPLEPIVRWVYGIYLERNQQPMGILSYDEVTAFIISFYKKYGFI